MNRGAVYHQSAGPMCYAYAKDELIISLKTGKDVKQVFLIYDDPYGDSPASDSPGHCAEMTDKKELKDHFWWSIQVHVRYRRLKYYFRLVADDETLCFLEDGFFSEEDSRPLRYFEMPWMHSADLGETPSWVNEVVWYEIFPDRFYRAPSSGKKTGIQPWREEGPVGFGETFGGNLRGITEKLDYLSDLGIGGLYLMPVCKGSKIHGYHTTDYETIAPLLGTEEDMKELVQEAHRRGIRVIMDAVFNHSGPLFGPWKDVRRKGPMSKYYDWFMVNSWPFCTRGDTRDGRYYSFAFYADMPKLNTSNEETAAYLEGICLSWIEKYDIDGIRLDACTELSHAFLKRLRRAVKAIRPDFYLLGETWHDGSKFLEGDELDGVSNFPLLCAIDDVFSNQKLTREDFMYRMNACYTMYRQQNNNALLNMLDSQDTQRLYTHLGDLGVMLQELTVLFTMPGAPLLFYGTEIVLEGEKDPDCRRCMPWGSMDQGIRRTCLNLIRKLIHLRGRERALRSLHYRFFTASNEDRLFAYKKLDEEGNQIEILLNASQTPIPISSSGEVLFSYLYENGILSPKGTLIQKK